MLLKILALIIIKFIKLGEKEFTNICIFSKYLELLFLNSKVLFKKIFDNIIVIFQSSRELIGGNIANCVF